MLLVTACSLDWAVRPDPGIGPVAEAGADVTDAPIAAADASDSATVDAPADLDANGCGALAANVAAAKASARACMLASGQCMASVMDECNCAIVVKAAGSPESVAYANAVAAFVASCPKPTCGTCLSTTIAQPSWACLQPGPTPTCYP